MKNILAFLLKLFVGLWPAGVIIYLFHGSLAYFNHVLRFAAAGSVLFFALYSPGKCIFSKCGLKAVTFIEEFSFSMAFGFSFIYLVFLFLGLVGLLSSLPVILITAFICILFSKYSISLIKELIYKIRKYSGNRFSLTGALFLIILVFCIGFAFIHAASLPAESYSLSGGLALSSVYSLKGDIYPVEADYISRLPDAMRVMQAGCFSIYGTYAARILSFLMLITLLATVYSMTRRYFHRRIALIAAIITVSTPVVVKSYITDSAFLGSMLYVLISFYSLLNWTYDMNKENYGTGWLASAGFFTALSLNYGYYTIFLPLVYISMLVVMRTKYSESNSKNDLAITIAVFFLPFIIFIMPVMFNNILTNANPVFPFFESPSSELGLADKGIRTAWGYLLPIWYIPFENEISFRNLFLMGPVYAVFIPALALIRDLGSTIRLLVRFIMLYLIVFLLAGRQTGFVYPYLPIFAVLSAYAITNISGIQRYLFKYVQIILILCIMINIYYVWPWLNIQKKTDFILGHISEEAYLTEASPAYSLIEYINSNSAKNSKVMLLGTSESLYLKRESISASPLDISPFVSYANSNDHNTARIYNVFTEHNVNYLIVNRAGLSSSRWDKENLASLKEFLDKYTKPVKNSGEYDLYRIS